jgi:hypothetical protein
MLLPLPLPSSVVPTCKRKLAFQICKETVWEQFIRPFCRHVQSGSNKSFLPKQQLEQNVTMDGLFTGPQAYSYYFRWALSDGCCRLPIEPLDG